MTYGIYRCAVCRVYHNQGGSTCNATACVTAWREYLRPRPEHERLERDYGRGRYAQSDRVRTDDEPVTRGKSARGPA